MTTVRRALPTAPKVEDLLVAAEDMAYYIHRNRFPIVIVGGAGAQPAAYMVKWQWNRLFPKEPLPRFCAIGKVHRGISGIISEVGTKQYGEQLFTQFPFLKKSRGEEIFIMEEFANDGKTIDLLHQTFEEMGFSRVQKGVMCIHDFPGWERVAKKFDYAFAITKEKPEFDQKRRLLVREALNSRRALVKKKSQAHDGVTIASHKALLNQRREELKSLRTRSRAVGR